MKPPQVLSDGDLKAYANEHLQYEVDMLVASAAILGHLAYKAGEGLIPWIIYNGLLNTFAIHARNLINFLYSRSRNTDRRTDIIIEDYVTPSLLASILPPISPLLDQTLAKAAKQVAHLTKDRIDYEKEGKEWKFVQLTQEILGILKVVVPYIPDTRIGSDFKIKLSWPVIRIPTIDIQIISIGTTPVGVSLKILNQ